MENDNKKKGIPNVSSDIDKDNVLGMEKTFLKDIEEDNVLDMEKVALTDIDKDNVSDVEKVALIDIEEDMAALKDIEENNVSDMEKAAMKDILEDVYKVILREREKEAMKVIAKDIPDYCHEYELSPRGQGFLKDIEEEDKKRGSAPKAGVADHLPAREKAILKAILKDIPKASVAYSLSAGEKDILKDIEKDMKNRNKKKSWLEQYVDCEGVHANPHFDDFLQQTHLTGSYLLIFIMRLTWSNIMIVALFHIFCLLLLLCMNLLIFFYDFTTDNNIIFRGIRATFDFIVCPGVWLVVKYYKYYEQQCPCNTDIYMVIYFMIYNVLLGILYHPAHSLIKRMLKSFEKEYDPTHFL